MSEETIRTLDSFDAPYGRQVTLENVTHDSGLQLLRIRIREGSRFTVMDVDSETALRWSTAMRVWASETPN